MSPAQRERRKALGNELRRLRGRAGITGDDLGRRLDISQPTVQRSETGKVTVRPERAVEWARICGADAAEIDLVRALADDALAEAGGLPLMMQPLDDIQAQIAAEEQASGTERNFQCLIVPGLLQTAAYARRILRLAGGHDEAELEAALALRLRRQQILGDPEREIEFVMTEGALRTVPAADGSGRPAPALLGAQVRHIASLGTLANVSITVIPQAHPMLMMPRVPFVLMERRAGGQPDQVLVELPHDHLILTDPVAVSTYRKHLDLFRESGLSGDDAVAFLQDLATSLQS
jgi:transcriptional regulator with XRE-family HTH domain